MNLIVYLPSYYEYFYVIMGLKTSPSFEELNEVTHGTVWFYRHNSGNAKDISTLLITMKRTEMARRWSGNICEPRSYLTSGTMRFNHSLSSPSFKEYAQMTSFPCLIERDNGDHRRPGSATAAVRISQRTVGMYKAASHMYIYSWSDAGDGSASDLKTLWLYHEDASFILPPLPPSAPYPPKAPHWDTDSPHIH